jgi:TPR repeat protein
MKRLLIIVLTVFTLTLSAYSQRHSGGMAGGGIHSSSHSDEYLASVIAESNRQRASEQAAKQIKEQQIQEAISQQVMRQSRTDAKKNTPEQLNSMTNRLFAFRKEQADKNNSATSQFNVGLMYMNGQGTVTNEVLGIQYIKTASTNGNSDAVIYLKKNNL